MRISELSRESGVSIPTIKYYLRDGLLPTGERTAPNQATYGEAHLRRLRLIRVLADVGGLTLESIRSVLGAIDGAETPLHDVLAAAHTSLRREKTEGSPRIDEARREVDAWLNEVGWNLGPDSPARDDLAAALSALRDLGWSVGPAAFSRYVPHADAIAEAEIAHLAGLPDRAAAVEATVIGTVVFERALSALRRLAHEHHSRTRFGKDE